MYLLFWLSFLLIFRSKHQLMLWPLNIDWHHLGFLGRLFPSPHPATISFLLYQHQWCSGGLAGMMIINKPNKHRHPHKKRYVIAVVRRNRCGACDCMDYQSLYRSNCLWKSFVCVPGSGCKAFFTLSISSESLSPGSRQKVFPLSGCSHASGDKGDERNSRNIPGATSGAVRFSSADNLFSISFAVIFDSPLSLIQDRKVVVQMWKAGLPGCVLIQFCRAFPPQLRQSHPKLQHLSRIQWR